MTYRLRNRIRRMIDNLRLAAIPGDTKDMVL